MSLSNNAIQRSTFHFAIGLRLFYLLFPLIAWILSEYFLAVVTVLYILMTGYLERADGADKLNEIFNKHNDDAEIKNLIA